MKRNPAKSGFLCTVFTIDRHGMRNVTARFVITKVTDEKAAKTLIEHSIPPEKNQFVEVEYILIY